MHKKIGFLLLLVWIAVGTSCAFIAGTEEEGVRRAPALNLRYVESLRSQESLRGNSWKEPQFGTAPATSLQQPTSVFADDFRVYVTDRYLSSTISPRVFVFDRGDRTATVLVTPAPPAEGKLLAPVSIAVDSVNVIYVADSQQGMVFGYDRNGKPLMVIGRAGELGKPTALAVDQTRERIYAADAAGHRINVLNGIGAVLFTIGNTGNPDEDFKFPTSIALDRDGTLYVLDAQRLWVNMYDPNGRFIKRIGLKIGSQADPLKLKGIAIDSDGHVYVTDMVSNNILIFDRDGGLLQTWGRTGNLAGDFWSPAGIFIDRRDLVYIADQMNGRIQVFQYSK